MCAEVEGGGKEAGVSRPDTVASGVPGWGLGFILKEVKRQSEV